MNAPAPIDSDQLLICLEGADATWAVHLQAHPCLAKEKPHLAKFDPTWNYAGPEGSKWLDTAVPDSILFVSIRYAAFIHDRLYEAGGFEHDRLLADVLFYHLIVKALDESYLNWSYKIPIVNVEVRTPRVLMKRAMQLANVYYQAVHMCGATSFNHH